MALLFVAYMIVAFVAGVIALAMPCCFSVLLPSYFAQSFKQKSRLVGMTLIFSAGIGTIMLPITLGVLALAQTIRANHNLIFVAGGFLMMILGSWTLWGQGMLPRLNLPVNLNRNDAQSVYVLGIFSGAATSCCAPVLAGVLVLSALSATLFEGLLIGFAYVAGMVFPLFLVALLWERYRVSGENPLRGRILGFKLFEREFSIHSSKLTAGLIFVAMGAVTVILGVTGTMIAPPGLDWVAVAQAQLAVALVKFFSDVETSETTALLGAVIVVVAILFVRKRKKSSVQRTVRCAKRELAPQKE